MTVNTVLVLWSVWVLAGAEPSEGVAVKQEVEKIFKNVEAYLSGASPEVGKNIKPTSSPGVSEGRHHKAPANEEESPEEVPVPPRAVPEDRAFSQPVTFPVGVIVSDNLYPLVVGKNVESGEPFVMNLDKQHALVVARSGGDDYRLVIPFPVMVGEPSSPGGYETDGSPSEYRSLPAGRPRKYRMRNPYYRPTSARNVHRKYPVNHPAYSTFNEGEPVSLQSDTNTPKVPKKYAQNQQPYRLQGNERPSRLQEPRYNSYHHNTPKKGITNPQYRSYYGEGRTNQPTASKNYDTPPMGEPRSKIQNVTASSYPKQQLSYHVEGPKYVPPRTPKHFATPTYRHAPSELYNYESPNYNSHPPPVASQAKNYPPRTYYGEQPVYNSYPPKSHPAKYGSVPRDFKPSPYVGNISHDGGRSPEHILDLEPQSERFESYDDHGGEFTEQDYLDSIRDSPELHSRSGGVRHVTYHADDYLGKIYEEMYYKLPDRPDTRSREQMATAHHVTDDTQPRLGPQEFPLQRFDAEESRNNTEAAESKTESVRFQEATNQVTHVYR